MVARYKALDIPTYWEGINAELVAQTDTAGAITKVDIRYPHAAARLFSRTTGRPIDTARSLIRHGFKKLMIFNGHEGIRRGWRRST